MSWEPKGWGSVALLVLAFPPALACAHADSDDPRPRTVEPDEVESPPESTSEAAVAGVSGGAARVDPPPAWAVPVPAPADLPRGRAIGDLDRATCHRLLRHAGVEFEVVDADDAEGVAIPILLGGPLSGIEIAHRGARHTGFLDCRLAIALLAWTPTLRAASITRIEHFSIYRPGARVRATGQPSGHAAGLAIDAGVFVRDGGPVAVVDAWTDHRRTVDTCRPPDDGEPEDQLLLRRLVCAAVAADLFQVVVTPNGNEDHEDHVHLELRPGVDWTDVN